MGTIRVLSADVANQIAAGEVVERPMSVVKELVENALDAGAQRIDVAIEGGGAERIVVGDDGCGMSAADARLAFERHATSKIAGAGDLRAITSFGFRGEALPSIASVARVTLTTSEGGGGEGARVTLGPGRPLASDPAPHPRGTTVEVEGLFASAPARRKFLRAAATETAHVADLLARVAAAHPGKGFTLKSGGRPLLSLPAAASSADRLAQILGVDDARAMLPVERAAGGVRVSGRASGPGLSRSTTRDQHLYVNARPIRDRRLLHAVHEAYASLLTRGRHPVVYLFLEVPPDQVDVNVHPAKSEVRFLRGALVHDLVRGAILDALGVGRPIHAPHRTALAEPAAPGWTEFRPGPAAGPEADPMDRPSPAGPAPAPGGAAGGEALLFAVPLAPLAQFRDSYILAAAPDGLVIVDQHAAHERILYERLLERQRQGGPERQRLLFPLTVEVSAAERQAFDGAARLLEEIGFGVEAFGERAIVVREIPAVAGGVEIEALTRDLLHEMLEWRAAEGVGLLRHRLAASAACHAAVTARHPLDPPRMRAIIDDLLRTAGPMTCPHGRPAVLRLGIDQIEREFRRR